MEIPTIYAEEGKWLFNGESFCKKVSGFGDLSKWINVTDEYKLQWEEEHKNNEDYTSSSNTLEERVSLLEEKVEDTTIKINNMTEN